jgi:hydrogenase-4 component F
MSGFFTLLAMARELATLPGLVALVPLVTAAGLVAIPDHRLAAWINLAGAGAAFALACALPWAPGAGLLLAVDPLAATWAILTSFTGLATAWFSRAAMTAEAASGRLDRPRLRLYHVLFQAALGAMLLALLANNVVATWVAIEAAGIALAVAVGLGRTAAAVAAAWKMLVLCGAGLAMAMFGTIVLYLAAAPALGTGLPAMSWSRLAEAAVAFHPALLNLAFVFLLLGSTGLAGLVPFGAWLPDACAEAPAPLAALLGAALPNVALVVMLRLRGVLAANAGAIVPGPPFMVLGLASVLVAAFGLWRQHDVKRFFAVSTMGQSGVAAFAFGLGGAGATFAGLLTMAVHLLAKAAVFQCAGEAARLKGGQRFADIGGLLAGHRALGVVLAGGMVALAGLPPFGLFIGTFLLLAETVRRLPWLALPLGLGLLAVGWALAARLISLCLGAPTPDRDTPVPLAALAPAWLALALALVLGLAMPAPIAAGLTAIAGAAR